MGSVAYALRDEHEGTVDLEVDGEAQTVPKFGGGLIRTGADSEIELREALDEGDGVIVVDDTDNAAIVALDGIVALKRVAVPEGAETIAGGYEDRDNSALRAELNRRGVQGAGNKNHDELVAALVSYDDLVEHDRLPADNLTVKAIADASDELDAEKGA